MGSLIPRLAGDSRICDLRGWGVGAEDCLRPVFLPPPRGGGNGGVRLPRSFCLLRLSLCSEGYKMKTQRRVTDCKQRISGSLMQITDCLSTSTMQIASLPLWWGRGEQPPPAEAVSG